MRTEELLVRLASEAEPVRPLAPIGARLVRWFAAAFAVVASGVLLVGPRADLATRFAELPFVTLLALLSLLSVSSAAVALAMSVPDERRSRLTIALPAVVGAIWAVTLAVGLASGGSIVEQLRAEPFHAVCGVQIAALAIIPAVVLFSMLRAGATIGLSWAGTLALGAALGAGAVGTAMVCPIDRAAHQAIWHFLPVAALAATGAWLGRVALDRLAR